MAKIRSLVRLQTKDGIWSWEIVSSGFIQLLVFSQGCPGSLHRDLLGPGREQSEVLEVA